MICHVKPRHVCHVMPIHAVSCSVLFCLVLFLLCEREREGIERKGERI